MQKTRLFSHNIDFVSHNLVFFIIFLCKNFESLVDWLLSLQLNINY